MPSRRSLVLAVTPALGLGAAWLHVRRNAGASGRRLRAAAAESPHARDGRFANTERSAGGARIGTERSAGGARIGTERSAGGARIGTERSAGGPRIGAGPGEPRPDVSARRIVRMLRHRNEVGVPPGEIPLAPLRLPPRAAALAATWLGHAGVLLEVDRTRVLVDPVWSTRVSPVPFFGPRRLHPPPGPLTAVAAGVGVVLISHDHYDHLDRPTVRRLARDTSATFVVPLGVDEHLRSWGVPAGRVVARDWDGTADVAGLRFTCLEARHFSGRWLTRNTTQWAAWSVAGPGHRVYVGGDTGPSRVHARTGTEHGPFDLTLLPIGAYAPIWPDIHATPEQALEAHLALRGDVLLPVHWATFNLGFHGWAEPVERLRRAAEEAGVRTAFPRVGERVEPGVGLPSAPWWSSL